ncbi:hypothetical protein LAC81_25455 [Ensifer adhaerens]|uniref:M12 family metallopeptidase n=1 Tax=Ensifer adhaerens TaxID=106592 RepID=UPI001CC0FF6A|nr:M12 family metallopeptidase [Ensifer adhaerens]MBZ7927046.1 hypothetical protein [Ensifer adhaerens]UAX96654.1 hypothetical protein LAC78_23030 [Ensifer adhaerens]UAY04002.1 hypothetical protein LAC80_21930 [Ensifer adhaerens]UAY11988.1 hypothetical protein LAC81_25455 [Ensifer adhaerens]
MADFKASLEIAIDENPDNDPARQNLPHSEAISLYKKKWNPKRRILNVSFLDEPTYLDKVIKNARGWEDHIGMNFRFGPSDPDILIAFDKGGSWSYIGTDSRYYAQRGRPSMNFGWFDSKTADGEFSRVCLHEFGHALSLVHEHSHPGGKISWKEKAVFAYYKKQGWSEDDVRRQIFKKYQLSQVNGSGYDQTSIMHYPIDASLVTDPSDAVGWNEQLSSLDKAVIAKLYPKATSQLPR